MYIHYKNAPWIFRILLIFMFVCLFLFFSVSRNHILFTPLVEHLNRLVDHRDPPAINTHIHNHACMKLAHLYWHLNVHLVSFKQYFRIYKSKTCVPVSRLAFLGRVSWPCRSLGREAGWRTWPMCVTEASDCVFWRRPLHCDWLPRIGNVSVGCSSMHA